MNKIIDNQPGGLSPMLAGCVACGCAPLVRSVCVGGNGGLGALVITGGSNISRYFDTIKTDIKYTIARDKNCACFVSSCKNYITKIRYNKKYLLRATKLKKLENSHTTRNSISQINQS